MKINKNLFYFFIFNSIIRNRKLSLSFVLILSSLILPIVSASSCPWGYDSSNCVGDNKNIIKTVGDNITNLYNSINQTINITNNYTYYVTNNTYNNITNNISNNYNYYLSNFTNIAILNQTNPDGQNITLGIGGWFKGLFEWFIDVASLPFISFNGTTLSLNSSAFCLSNGTGCTSSIDWGSAISGNITQVNSAIAGNITQVNSAIAGNITQVNSAIAGNISQVNSAIVGNATLLGTSIIGNITQVNSDIKSNMTNIYSSLSQNVSNLNLAIIGNSSIYYSDGVYIIKNSSNGLNFNSTPLNLTEYAKYQFTTNKFNGSGNFTTGGFIDSLNIIGSTGSGIIWVNHSNEFAEVEINCTGLNCVYNAFEVRLVNTSSDVRYCYIPAGTIAIDDDTHNVLYIDNNCAVQKTSIQNYIQTPISPGGIADFANIVAEGGGTYDTNGIGLENKRIIKLRKLLLQSDGRHLSIVDGGFNKYNLTFPQFNISAGQYVYLMDIVPTTNRDTATNKLEVIYHTGAGTWGTADQTGLNITTCDTGSGIADCTVGTGSNTKYRRHFVFMIGYNESEGDSSQLHQLLPLQAVTYSSISSCLDTTTNPLQYTLPTYYQYAAVPLYAYCARADDTSWVNTNWIDLRTVKTGSAGTGIDTTAFLNKDGSVALTGNWNYGVYNINGSGNVSASWFFGKLNYSWIQNAPTFTTYADMTGAINGNVSNVLSSLAGNISQVNSAIIGNATLLGTSIVGNRTAINNDIKLNVTDIMSSIAGNTSALGTSILGNISRNDMHTHNAINITAGTFGAGNYNMTSNLSMDGVNQGLKFGNGMIYWNGSVLVIKVT